MIIRKFFEQFVLFAEFVYPQLIKQGSESELMKAISKVKLIKAKIDFIGISENSPEYKAKARGGGYGNRTLTPVVKTSIQDTKKTLRY